MKPANEQLVPGTWSQAAKGLWPREYAIVPGTILYRFINLASQDYLSAADGPWWFEYEHFQTIKHFGQRNGYSLGYSARLFAAILYEWSEVNAVVHARTKVRLAAWKGRGKQITVEQPAKDSRDQNKTAHGFITEASPQNVSKMTPVQGPNEVYQLHIPGLGRPHHKLGAYFDYIGYEPIQTG